MKNTLLIIISSFLPLTLMKLFAEVNNSLAQPEQRQRQMAQTQSGSSSSPGLGTYSLPSGAISEKDIPGIRTVLQQVLGRISESIGPSGSRADYQTIKSGMLAFQDWLRRQGCVNQASAGYDLEATDKYPDNIFMTYPGQLPFDITFNMAEDMKKPYRLLIFVTPAELFNFASLVENRSIGGVPVPQSWPRDTWSYWENRT